MQGQGDAESFALNVRRSSRDGRKPGPCRQSGWATRILCPSRSRITLAVASSLGHRWIGVDRSGADMARNAEATLETSQHRCKVCRNCTIRSPTLLCTGRSRMTLPHDGLTGLHRCTEAFLDHKGISPRGLPEPGSKGTGLEPTVRVAGHPVRSGMRDAPTESGYVAERSWPSRRDHGSGNGSGTPARGIATSGVGRGSTGTSGNFRRAPEALAPEAGSASVAKSNPEAARLAVPADPGARIHRPNAVRIPISTD